MPRIARISISRDPRNSVRPWLVNIPASLSQTGGRERPSYATRGEAERAKSEEERRLADYSRRALGLTDAQQIEAAECFTLVEPYAPHSLRDAVRLACGMWEAESRSVPVSILSQRVLSAQEQDGASQDHRRTTRLVLTAFSEDFCERSVASISTGEIDAWLRGQIKNDGEPMAATSRNAYRRYLSLAWSHARTQGWVRENIVADVPQAKEEEEDVIFLSPEQAEAFLRACSPRLIAHTALCLFGGLRPAEAAKLTWQEIGATEFRVRASIAKTRRNRHPPVSAQLAEWLSCAWRRPDGRIGFSVDDHRAAARAAGLHPWPQNCLRHSYGTFGWLVMDEDTLARNMGNSPAIIIKDYRGVATRSDADRFFALMPNEADRAKLRTYTPPRRIRRRKA